MLKRQYIGEKNEVVLVRSGCKWLPSENRKDERKVYAFMHTLKINLHVPEHAVQGPFSLQVLWFKKECFLVLLPTIL